MHVALEALAMCALPGDMCPNCFQVIGVARLQFIPGRSPDIH